MTATQASAADARSEVAARREATAHKLGGTAPPRLEVRGVSLSIRGRVILDEIAFELREGEVVGILGPNGSGKTSLLRCMTGLIRPGVGSVWLDGEALSAAHRALRAKIGVVFQHPSLDLQLTAIENVVLGGQLVGLGTKEARARARELLDFMELGDRAREAARTLSGGMRRRLEIARALIAEPTVLLLDEPTAGLDLAAFERTWKRLRAVHRARELTVLASTHNPAEASKCDRLIVLDRGHVVADDTPENLMLRVSGDIVTMRTANPRGLVTDLSEAFNLTARVEGQLVHLEVDRAHELIPRLVESFAPGHFASISLRRPTLADAFFHLTGHSLADDEHES